VRGACTIALAAGFGSRFESGKRVNPASELSHTLIEILLVLVFVLALHVLASGFELSISLLEIIVWAVGGSLLVIFGSRWLVNKMSEGVLDGWTRRKQTPAEEGLALLRKGDLDGAELVLARCLKRKPSDAEALRGLAEIAFRRGNFEQFLLLISQLLNQPDALRPSERVTLAHRQADVCLEELKDPQRAVEALARIEVDHPGTTDALRARQRIERILAASTSEEL